MHLLTLLLDISHACMRWLAAIQAAMQIAAVVSCILSNRWLNQQPMCNSIDFRLPVRKEQCPLCACFVQSFGHIHSLISRCPKNCKVSLYTQLICAFGLHFWRQKLYLHSNFLLSQGGKKHAIPASFGQFPPPGQPQRPFRRKKKLSGGSVGAAEFPGGHRRPLPPIPVWRAFSPGQFPPPGLAGWKWREVKKKFSRECWDIPWRESPSIGSCCKTGILFHARFA